MHLYPSYYIVLFISMPPITSSCTPLCLLLCRLVNLYSSYYIVLFTCCLLLYRWNHGFIWIFQSNCYCCWGTTRMKAYFEYWRCTVYLFFKCVVTCADAPCLVCLVFDASVSRSLSGDRNTSLLIRVIDYPAAAHSLGSENLL